MPTRFQSQDLPPPPGAAIAGRGTNFSVYAGRATKAWVCLFDNGDARGTSERRIPLEERSYGYWFGHLSEVGAGQRYGFRVDGPWDPTRGMRHNPAKLLLDPYAKAIEGAITWRPEVFGHKVGASLGGDGLVQDGRDSRAYMPRSVVIDDAFDWGADRLPDHSLAHSLIYEVHVKNFTALHPRVPLRLRGTYAGLAHPAAIEHLHALGVTAVELLPIHSFASEPRFRGSLRNHWGYNTLGFFAPHARYAAAEDPQGVVDEFKGMVKLLHAAGIEVILDVVYNHSAEWGSGTGPQLNFRGLDNRAYYRLDGRGADLDVTGCGNTLNARHAAYVELVLSSLRYWSQVCHVDGFRFDLAVATARGKDDAYDPDHPLLMAIRSDPVLSRRKLIAEPWDLGSHGWRSGQFPPPFSEWNDRFRDATRSFWLVDRARDRVGQPGGGVRDLATRLGGSEDMFARWDRGTIASINFVAAHDGFTIADLTSYNVKHNIPNGEDNNDGANDNRSFNHGIEGPTDDPDILRNRRRSMRNLLGTLFVATGVPMMNAGDEFGRSQRGNNNTYCQDNEVSWFDWDLAEWQRDLLTTTRFLSRLRREHPVLRQRSFFTGRPVHTDGTTDLMWYDGDGDPMAHHRWEDGHNRTVQMLYDGRWLGGNSLLIVFHGGALDGQVTLPRPAGAKGFQLLWDSADETPRAGAFVELTTALPEVSVTAASMQIYRMVVG